MADLEDERAAALARKFSITKGHILEYFEVFRLFDADGSGQIDESELGTAFKKMGQTNLSDDQIRTYVSDIDTNHDGVVDFEEFLTLMIAQPALELSSQELEAAFARLDQDGDGYITARELRSTMKSVGLSLSEREIRKMLNHAGDDLRIVTFTAQCLGTPGGACYTRLLCGMEGVVDKVDLRDAILSFLIHHCYEDTARLYTAEINGQRNFAHITQRRELRDLINEGNSLMALNLAERHFRDVLEANPKARFMLNCLRFVELVGNSSAEEALSFANASWEPSAAASGSTDMLQEMIPLIAYQEPARSPLAQFMRPGFRARVFTFVNCAILEHYGVEPETLSRVVMECSSSIELPELSCDDRTMRT